MKSRAKRRSRRWIGGVHFKVYWLSAFFLAAWFAPASAQAAAGTDKPALLGSSEDDRLRLFQSVFGGKNSQGTATVALGFFTVPLFMEGVAVAQIRVKATSGETRPRIELASLLAALAPLMEPGSLSRLRAHADAKGFLNLVDLRGDGWTVRFDLQRLALFLDLPVQLRRLKEIRIGPGPPAIDANGVVPTAELSSYLNVLGNLDYLHSPSSAQGGLQANVALAGAVNFRGAVFEGSLMYSDQAQNRVQRGALRLVYDIPARIVRYSAGDLIYPVAGFQSFVPMAGISITRNFSLQPYFTPQPTGAQDFVLDQQSQVEVLVNGIEQKILTLPAGRYDLHDFQFSQGANDVELRATDAVGRISTISAPFFFSSNLLAAGVDEFSYNLGQPSYAGAEGYIYNTGLSLLSGFHRVGINDNLTVGGNFQGSLKQQQLGGEFTFASALGIVHMDMAGSRQNGSGFGGALRLSYNLTDFGAQSSSSSLLAQATYIGRNFSTPNSPYPINPIALNLGLRYTWRILSGTYASAGASGQIRRDGQRNGHNFSLSVQHAFARGLIGNLRLEQSVEGGAKAVLGAIIAISWQLGDGHSSIQSTYDTAQDTAQASYQYSPSNFVGEPGGTVTVARSKGQERVNGSLFYNANRFETSLSQDALIPSGNGGQESGQRTSLRVGTSLVYADGHFGVSRPIGDSFAVVAPDQNYADQEIILDSSGAADRHEAQTDVLGPAILPDLTAYQVRTMSVAIPDLPAGYQLRQDQYQLLPTYRSGTVIVVGNDATVVLDGVLVDRLGVPLGLMAGEVVAVDRKDADIGQFFTNRQGRFRIDGVGPGTFDLRLAQYPGVSARLTIPPATKGIYIIGQIKLAVRTTTEAIK